MVNNGSPVDFLVSFRFDQFEKVQKDFSPSNSVVIESVVGAEAELSLLREVVAGSADAIFAKDVGGRYILVNDACARLLGRPTSEILGRDDTTLHDPELARITIERDRRVLSSGQPETYEVMDSETLQGDRRYLVAKWVHRNGCGEPVGLVGVARDISDARRQEQALRERESQFRLLAENSTDLISRHDPDGTYRYASPACRRLFGFEPEELIGRSAYETIHPDDVMTVEEVHHRLLDSAETFTITFRARRKDDTYTWVETTSRAVRDPSAGKVTEIHCSTRDISDRRHAEEELRSSRALLQAVLDNSTAVIYAKDLNGRYLLLNRWYEEIFQLRREHLLGRTDHDVFPEPIADVFRANDLKVLEAGQPIEFEEVAPREDGPHTYLSIKCPILDGDGKPTAVCGISTDITERKRYEEQLRIKNARLEESIRSERHAHEALKRAESQLVQAEKLTALGQMVAGVAHEINNPLSYVNNNVAVLRRDLVLLRELVLLYRQGDEALAECRPELFRRVVELAERMDLDYTLDNLDDLTDRSAEGLRRIRQIVRDLRDFARPGEDGLHVADLNTGINSTVNIVTGPARDRGIEVVADLKSLPRIVCQSARINQVLLNLLLNALDATPPGGTVTVRLSARAGRRVDRRGRHRPWDRTGDPPQDLRSLLHYQADWQGDRTRTVHQLRDHPGSWRSDRGRERAREWNVLYYPPPRRTAGHEAAECLMTQGRGCVLIVIETSSPRPHWPVG